MKSFMKEATLSTGITFITLCLLQLSLAAEFSYKNADSWANEWSACGGERQSPIDIDYFDIDTSYRDEYIETLNYDAIPQSVRLVNNGHTVKMEYEWEDEVPTLTAEILNGEFRLDSVHFHWDTLSANGSEHTFQRQSTAMEIHFVHYNTKYESITEALEHEDGLAVIGKFIYLAKMKTDSSDSLELNEVLSSFSSVPTPGAVADIEPMSVASFAHFGTNMPGCIIYPGSLTTPPCNENVMWVLNPFMHFITEEQLEEVQNSVQLNFRDDHNFRPTQPLNGRKLFLIGEAVYYV